MFDYKSTSNAGLKRATKPKPLSTRYHYSSPTDSLGSGVTLPLLLSPQEAIGSSMPSTPRTPRTPQTPTFRKPVNVSIDTSYYDIPIAPWDTRYNTTAPLAPKPNYFYEDLLDYSEDDNDDDIPLGISGLVPFGTTTLAEALIANKSCSLLSDSYDEDDEDLVPIAMLSQSNGLHSAAEKYKEKVMERLHMSASGRN
ncbi:hypothetical protein EC973_003198 [Apophysomyces ossiformis]|uniref:Uncharacterized protein n=1 Tax=Apophysomyces ossiformis TaxID=679940 RepID=A0A8H7BRF4_9FUNG|nr:hypothetical protein EC973_003198 [Apophysomyces ossiformis]